jgi:4a-hydroxytetrahydrobiopterin dehydratase
MKLFEQRCAPCEKGGIPLSRDEAMELHREVPDWKLKDKEIEREFKLKDFRQAMEFVNEVAALAEEQGHHPDMYIYYNKVRLVLSTHKIGGLSHNDFIMAAQIDEMMKESQALAT